MVVGVGSLPMQVGSRPDLCVNTTVGTAPVLCYHRGCDVRQLHKVSTVASFVHV